MVRFVSQGVEQMAEMHHGVPIFYRRPFQRKGVLVLVAALFFREDVFFNAPPSPGGGIAPIHCLFRRQPLR